MENASKALLMAGGILIALITIAVLVRSFTTIGIFQKAQMTEEEQAQLVEFNEQYTKYLGQHMYGTEVITVINKSINNKSHPITVSIKFKGEYPYKGYREYVVEVNGKKYKRWKEENIVIGEGKTVTIENGEVLDENMTSFINSLGSTDLNNKAFKCTNVGYNSDGRVNSIKFEEKQWGDLY